MQQCLPFIRCAALFYHFLTGVISPTVLSDKGRYLKSFVRFSILRPVKTLSLILQSGWLFTSITKLQICIPCDVFFCHCLAAFLVDAFKVILLDNLRACILVHHCVRYFTFCHIPAPPIAGYLLVLLYSGIILDTKSGNSSGVVKIDAT